MSKPSKLQLAQVNRAIRHLGIRAHRGRGYYYWTSIHKDTEPFSQDLPSVYVNDVHHLTLERWVSEAKWALSEAKKGC